MLPLDQIPTEFHTPLLRQIELWQDHVSDDQQRKLQLCFDESPALQGQLARMWGLSDFVARFALEQTDDFLFCLASQWLTQPLSFSEMNAQLAGCCEEFFEASDELGFNRVLRVFRRRMMLRVLWRDLCRLGSMQETVGDMSNMADVVIQAAIRFFYRSLESRWGKPIGKISGLEQPLVVLGMGKLGGRELNVSSDIDLIFAYPESGETQGGRKSVSNQEFFIKLGQKIIQSIDTVTADGFVFRVDMRLRPYGQSGALVLNFDALEEYYQSQGREWERYAMIKARVVSGDVVSGDAIVGGDKAGQRLMTMLQPFTYRRYLDFSAIDSMRDMKALINREVQRKGMSTDVKLGSGGIREIEFIVQVFQLIRGGRDKRFRERQVLVLLPLLASEELLAQGASTALANAYVFLRNVEHAIQGYQDKQTQSLPIDELGCQRLAWAMDFSSWDAFYSALEQHRSCVRESFNEVIADPEAEEVNADCSEVDSSNSWPLWVPAWIDDLSIEQLQHQLQEMALDEPDQVAKIITDLKQSRVLMNMQAEGRKRLDDLMPRLLHALHSQHESAATLQRVVTFIETVSRRTTYLVLLLENPKALQQLIALFSGSCLIAEQLSRYPVLLDELLDVRTLYSPPAKQELLSELRQQMLRVERDDLEQQMEVLRYFRLAHSLRVAASEITGALPLMKVSDYLTWLAETLLEHVLEIAWQQMTDKHGEPGLVGSNSGSDSGSDLESDAAPPEFIIVGYGKMGGIELGHGSDLDLVFIHNAVPTAYTQGDKSIDNQTFFTRLGQRIIHILGTQTLTGKLYEVDMRLRPSGNSGLLVCTLNAFKKYQQNDAWTWEHQALVRARVVAGGAGLQNEFEEVRKNVLAQPRELQPLKMDVINMRTKMRDHLGTQGGGAQDQKADAVGSFHIKQDSGGIVDIEFMTQYAVLAWAHQAPDLARFTDNVRILESLEAAKLMDAEQVLKLIEAYKTYRSTGHRLALQNNEAVVDGGQFIEQRRQVQEIWQALLGT
jgi:glutamate-ammonia-ligase adenylyltransferase